MISQPLFVVEGLAKRFGEFVVTDKVSLDLCGGEVHALIGPNGAGKSTLVHLLSGLVTTDSGRIQLAGQDLTHMPPHRRVRHGLGRCFQITSIFRSSSVRENLRLALQCRRTSSFRFFNDRNAVAGLAERVDELASRLGLTRELDRIAGTLTHASQRRLDLALALASEPKVLLLDEPMAGLGPDESAELVDLIQGLRSHAGILLIEHDMDAVFKLADRISVLVQGRIFASGPPKRIRENADVQAVYLGAKEHS